MIQTSKPALELLVPHKISNHPNNEINTPDIIFQFYSPVNNYSEYNIKDRLAIAIRSLKDRCVTIVSLTQVGVGVMCGWCLACCTGVVLSTVRERATPDCKENKQGGAGSGFFRRQFLCVALLCNCSSAEREGLSTHVLRECSAEHFMRNILSRRIFTSLPGSRLRFFIAMQIQYSY